MTVSEVTEIIEEFAPIEYKEEYDNVGLLVGSASNPVNGILLTLDVTPEVLDDALANGANLIIAHHPVIFKGLKKLTGSSYTERTIIKAIKHGIAIYCAHTNLDSVWNGVSMSMAKKMGLKNIRVLHEATDQLVKLITFVPNKNVIEVRQSMFNAGAGNIGHYDQCSYNIQGTGTFRAGDGTNPHVGDIGHLHQEQETRVEMIVPKPILAKAISAMKRTHPYEEVAYDVVPLLNANPRAGLGLIGDMPKSIKEPEFLKKVKNTFNLRCIRHSPFTNNNVKKVALCGGSGANLIPKAISLGANAFITADVKYHQFFDADNKILLADIGHFESEHYTIDIFYELLTKKIPNFAVLKTKVKTNPINYLY
ncbi:MAG: Nif3-like dinuclear metal center hexameric protein [Bacteroidales bacterium]